MKNILDFLTILKVPKTNKGINHIKTRVGAPDSVFNADQQETWLVNTFGDVELVKRDTSFVIQDGVRDNTIQVINEALVDLFE